jgi:hypothetical protein
MNNSSINILPVEKVKTTVITKLNVSVIRFELFIGATLHVSLESSDGERLDSQILEITGDDYKRWSNDDLYVYSWTAEKLGLQLNPIVAAAPAPAIEEVVTDSTPEPTPPPASAPAPAPAPE